MTVCCNSKLVSLRKESSLFVSEQHSVKYFCLVSTLSTCKLSLSCYSCMGLVPSHLLPVTNILQAKLCPQLHFCLESICTGVQL